jgi:prepilin-type N-terminal cleavage/methylation domain-containing protein
MQNAEQNGDGGSRKLRNVRPFCALRSALCALRSRSAFTLIEMLVVLGIIALVTAMTLPMIIPMMRTRTLDSAVDTVKSACILARSTAIQQRKMMNLTFLQQTDSTHGPGIVLTGYDFAGAVTASGTINTFTDNNQNWNNNSFQNCQVLLFSAGTPTPQQRTIQSVTNNNTISILPTSAWSASVNYSLGNMVSYGGIGYICIADNANSVPSSSNTNWQCLSWGTGLPGNPLPQPGNVYVVMSAISPSQPYCIHNLSNYGYTGSGLASNDIRFLVLKTFSQYMGETLQYLPTGCQFDFGTGYAAWSSSVGYSVGNIVSDKGVVYLCIAANAGSEPPNSNWQILGAWTYVFLPDGEAWTLLPSATNTRDTNWILTTYMVNGAVSGPKIWGPNNLTSSTISVYATTGQVVSQ